MGKRLRISVNSFIAREGTARGLIDSPERDRMPRMPTHTWHAASILASSLNAIRARRVGIASHIPGPFQSQFRVDVERRPRHLAAEEPRAAALRVASRARAEKRTHARCGVVYRCCKKPFDPVAPLAEVANNKIDDGSERTQPAEHRAVSAARCAAEFLVDFFARRFRVQAES